ncbi:MAG: DEAD/DEAH box helicase, partial [Planctomycetes bacterium]|nr:DEAD/DEAH box helicase [Planctomycetota bacterium]
VHRLGSSLLLCYVDHHDKAYAWAERRKLEIHPKTGAAQIVEIRETVRDVIIPRHVADDAPAAPAATMAKAPLFADRSDEELLGFGVPAEWLTAVRDATEDSILALCEHLPAEAGEALLELAVGGTPRAAEPAAAAASPFDHPDAQRRFRIVANVDDLRLALESPWEKWTIFLHPDQRGWVERDYAGPARVAGSAGTGKTIVAIHRAAHLARANADARVLLTTFSDTLASALQTKLKRLLANEPRLGERIDVGSFEAVALRLYRAHVGAARFATADDVRSRIREAAREVDGHKLGAHFLVGEWEHVVDSWQIDTWEAYRDVARLGRKTRLPESLRKVVWAIFERVHRGLRDDGLITLPAMYSALSAAITKRGQTIFDFVVVDEAQDLGVSQLRLIAVLGAGRPNALFFAGDLGQRIFQQPFSWKSLGVDVRGRSRTLRVNYRTSHQIRMHADGLLGPTVTDMDGIVEERKGTVSVFNGPAPSVAQFASIDEEIVGVAAWIDERTRDGLLPHEFGVFVRSDAEIERARAAVNRTKLASKLLDDRVDTASGHVAVGTMHRAKGLEFRAVVVMACDDEILPLQSRIESVGDDGDLEEVYDTERQLLYVACTRARDQLFVSGVAPASEFLDDLAGGVRPTQGTDM